MASGFWSNLGQKGLEGEKKVEEGDNSGDWEESPPPRSH